MGGRALQLPPTAAGTPNLRSSQTVGHHTPLEQRKGPPPYFFFPFFFPFLVTFFAAFLTAAFLQPVTAI